MRLKLKTPAHDGLKWYPVGYTDSWPDDIEPPSSAVKVSAADFPAAEETPPLPTTTLRELTPQTKAELKKQIRQEMEREAKKKAAKEKET